MRGILHHEAHGLYAFAASGFGDATVLVVDSLGDASTTSIATASRAGNQARYQISETIRDRPRSATPTAR